MVEFGTEPKSAKGKRIKAARENAIVEEDKVTMFLRGNNCSGEVSRLMTDLANLKKPLVLPRKRDVNIYPFEDSSHIERMASIAGTGLVVLGESSKKRKTAVVLMRMFNDQLLDSIELIISNYQPSSSFKGVEGCSVGAKPLLIFQGAGFSATSGTPLSRAKNMFLDVFKGSNPKGVSLDGVQHTIVISECEDGKLRFRVYKINKKRGDTPNIPKVELVEMGPSFDFTLGRERLPDFTLWKASLKKPIKISTTSKTSEGEQKKTKKNKNISTDALGQTIGRIHMGRQDYTKLNTPHRAEDYPKKKRTSTASDVSPSKKVKA